MSPEIIFKICNALVLPGWLLLIFLPKWKWSAKIIAAVIIPAILAIVYTYLMATHFFDAQGGGFNSLEQVSALFQNKFIILAGWIHYLAFDLFIGCWEVRDSQRLGIKHWWLIPCLILTFLAGPAGLLLYFLFKFVNKKSLIVE